MSEEFEIPAELADLEHRLRGSSLPPANLGRDTLMYQAGWAAAINQPCKTPAVRSSATRWRATAGLLGALATALAIILYQQKLVDQTTSETSSAVVVESDSKHIETQERSVTVVPAIKNFESETAPVKQFNPNQFQRRFLKTESLVAWSPRSSSRFALRNAFDDPTWTRTTLVYPSSDEPFEKTKTNFELMKELLPRSEKVSFETERSEPILGWILRKLGDSI